MDELLKIKETTNENLWNEFLFKSENKNIYSRSELINTFKIKNKKFFIFKKNEIWASFHFFFDKKKIIQGKLIYCPLNFRKFDNYNKSSLNYKKYSIIKKYTNFVVENYQSGKFTLDYFCKDMRPFYWCNFDRKKTIFKIDEIKYTSLIDLDFKKSNNLEKMKDIEKTELFNNFSRSIKQQIRSANKNEMIFKERFDEKFAIKILTKTLSRQNQNLDFNIENLFKTYKRLNKKKLLKMFIASEKNIDMSFTIFGIIGNNAIYLNGGRLNEENNDYSLTFNLANSLMMLNKEGIKTIDLEGVNSPKRAFWKIGFGGDIVPYFRINFKL